jgi:hypothetical protein
MNMSAKLVKLRALLSDPGRWFKGALGLGADGLPIAGGFAARPLKIQGRSHVEGPQNHR